MKKILGAGGALLLSAAAAYLLISGVVVPLLENYPRLENMMARFQYSEETLIIFVTLAVWLFLLQWHYRTFSMIYIYLFYTVYLFFLFVMLFTKAQTYHSFSLNPFDFLRPNILILKEAFLNVVYFVPLGALYGLRARPLEFITIALLTIFGIETIQYVFFIGTFDMSDVLLNFIGCTCGYLFCGLFKRRMKLK